MFIQFINLELFAHYQEACDIIQQVTDSRSSWISGDLFLNLLKEDVWLSGALKQDVIPEALAA